MDYTVPSPRGYIIYNLTHSTRFSLNSSPCPSQFLNPSSNPAEQVLNPRRVSVGEFPSFIHSGLEDEALEVGAAARNASAIIGAAVARVQRVDEGVGPLRDLIEGAAENIDIATAALDQAESQCE